MSQVIINKQHLALAFLCPVNRNATMIEHNCNQWELLQNPMWLLDHYFTHSGVNLTKEEKQAIIDFTKTRNGQQITAAFLCPINRHATRVEYGCSDEFFIIGNNYEYLIGHYIVNGGAAAFAKLRQEEMEKVYAGK